jgi:hypothetical protein
MAPEPSARGHVVCRRDPELLRSHVTVVCWERSADDTPRHLHQRRGCSVLPSADERREPGPVAVGAAIGCNRPGPPIVRTDRRVPDRIGQQAPPPSCGRGLPRRGPPGGRDATNSHRRAGKVTVLLLGLAALGRMVQTMAAPEGMPVNRTRQICPLGTANSAHSGRRCGSVHADVQCISSTTPRTPQHPPAYALATTLDR